MSNKRNQIVTKHTQQNQKTSEKLLTSQQSKEQESVINFKEDSSQRDEFGATLREPSFVNTVDAVRIEQEIELPSSIYAFHKDLAREFDHRNFAEHIRFVLRDYARYLLKENPRRLGELIAESKMRGHCIQEWELDDINTES